MAKNLEDVIKTNWVSGGPKVKRFEGEWGNLFTYKHNVSMDNGTSADIALLDGSSFSGYQLMHRSELIALERPRYAPPTNPISIRYHL